MKIAIVGTAQQWVEAPFEDTEWKIWCLAGVWPQAKRTNRLYELHGHDIVESVYGVKDGFYKFANMIGHDFVVQEKNDKYPKARIYDKDKYLNRYGRFPFGSSVAWIMAEAIDEIERSGDKDNTIGLYGINMADGTEYAAQKPGCFFFAGICSAKGIDLAIPETSELFSISHLYGFEKPSDNVTILKAKKKEMQEKLEMSRQQELQAVRDIYRNIGYAQGSSDTIDWQLNNNMVR